MHDPTNKFSGTLSPKAEKIAKIISLVEQPPFLSVVPFVLICMLMSKDVMTGVLGSVIAIVVAVVLPVVNIMYFSKKFDNSDRLDVVNKEQRMKPLIIGVICYGFGTALLYLIGAPWIAVVLMLCYTIVTAIIAAITPYWKISIHACGIIGPSIGLTVAFGPIGLLYFLLLPPVMWSRYVLQKHTPLQLVMGAVVGFISTGTIFLLLL